MKDEAVSQRRLNTLSCSFVFLLSVCFVYLISVLVIQIVNQKVEIMSDVINGVFLVEFDLLKGKRVRMGLLGVCFVILVLALLLKRSMERVDVKKVAKALEVFEKELVSKTGVWV